METFLEAIKSFTSESVESIKKDEFHMIYEGESRPLREDQQSLGKCPACGSDVVEGEKGFGCTNCERWLYNLLFGKTINSLPV